MSRWPWHLTQFYLEWLTQIADQAETDGQQQNIAASSSGLAGLAGLSAMGAQVREVN